ncbi:TetR/AcrR family transcriptional regulator [Chelatococcus reniformis]|uniref:TetR family transcriptional regulator n=1 Tax=Chelatococcus reniformis TaxID=1494448 RepID=A0A916XJD0_9HYPH|nr:TetR/AcrR family transcriptional regulator [Chelatococcus reniformis]GGC74757.1 TetR family transcriptional regulator [Chelatococcus reniformis]
MARTRSDNFEAIQQSILKQAVDLFASQGYMRSTIADLADACEVSRGALYHYFDSKEAILFAILHNHVSKLLAIIEAAAGEREGARAQLHRMVEAIVEYNARSPGEQVVLLNDLTFLDKKEQEIIEGLERHIVDLFADALVRVDSHGRIDRKTKKVYTMSLLGMINYSYTWFDPAGSVEPREFAAIICDTFLDGFAASAGAVPRPVPVDPPAAPRRRTRAGS